jgi:transketolase
MPCVELFERQDAAYRESVLPAAVTARVSVEAAATFGWCRFTGAAGRSVGIDRFGASAPGNVNLEKLGFTVDAVVKAVESVARVTA